MQKPKLRKIGRVFAAAMFKAQVMIALGPSAIGWTESAVQAKHLCPTDVPSSGGCFFGISPSLLVNVLA